MQMTHFVADGLEEMKRKHVFESDSQSVFMERQLTAIEARLYDKKLRPLSSVMAIPVDTTGPAGAKSIGYFMYTQTGMARILAAPSDDLPRVDIYGEEVLAKVKQGGAAFGYTTQELRSAVMAGVPLDIRKASAARRAIDELQERLAWNGDANNGIPGLLTNPNITKVEAPLNAGATSRLWENKTAQEIIDDINDGVNNIITLSKNTFSPTTLLLPISLYTYIKSKRLSDTVGQPMTILGWITSSEAMTGINEVIPVYELETAGPDGSRMMCVYEKNEDNLQQRVPLPMIMHPAQAKNLEFVIPVEAEFAGTVVRYPVAFQFTYGI